MSWTGGHSGQSGLPAGLPWPGGPPMPPSHHHQTAHYRQQSGRHEQDKQAAARRRKEEARQARVEQRRNAEHVDNDSLFSKPRKTDGSRQTEVEKVMGNFEAAQNIIESAAWSLGVDYQPPTPAPAKEYVIGEEDEEEPSHKPPPVRPRPPPFPSSSRQHPHMMGQILKPPPPKSSNRSSSGGSGNMAPPSSLPIKTHKQHSQSQSSNTIPKKQPTQPKLSPLKMPSHEKKPVAPSNEDEDAVIKAMMNEMKYPSLSDNGGLPTPLTAIMTPSVDVEERGVQKHKPVYPTIFNPFKVEDTGSKSPSRKNSESEKKSSSVSKGNEGSSSSEDSSSGSESEESDKDDANMAFGLSTILQTNKTSPGMSERSVKPTPSPRQPTPSPLYSSHPTPSPAAGVATPATPYSGDNNDDPGSPTMPTMPTIPPPINPLSPMRDSEPEFEPPVKQSAGKIRHSVSSSKLSSDDEEERIKEKQRKSSKHRSRKSSNKSKSGSGSERVKSRKVVTEDSDSELDIKPHVRSLSNSPIKKPSSKNLGSAHSTPRQRPSSTQSTPARDKLSESLNSLVSSSKSRKQQSRTKTMNLSEDSDDDEVKHPTRSPATAANKKNHILSKMFMFKGSSGGKGKDKGRAAGGITVMDREESDDIDDEKHVTKAKSSPSIKSSRSSHKGSPAVKIEKDKDSSWMDNNRENSALVANSMKKDALDNDLMLSDDSINSPVISRHAPVFPSQQTDGKPSLLMSIPLSRIGRSLDTFHSKFKQKSRKAPVKQECWITSGDEKGSSGGGSRKRKPSQSPVKEKLCSPDPGHVRHSSGSSKPCDNLSVQHRKSKERTLHSESEPSKPESSRKRRDRDSSPGQYDSDHYSKRMRTTPQDSFSSETIHDNYYNQDMEPPPPDPSLLPSSQSSWSAPGNLMMPPPYPPKRVYYSYFERKHQEEEFDDEENVVDEAKRVKREADNEENMYIKCRKYLQAIMMWVVCGSRTETIGDKIGAYEIYIQTLTLIKFVMKLTNSSRNNNQDVDIRLVVFSLRAQSLLNLKLYKMKKHELKDYQKTIQDVLAKSVDDPSSSDQGQSRAEQMSTPSPAGSDGSRSSDYYSSGENRLSGVLTPPTAPTVCLSIPKNVMQNQYNFCSYLSQCHELWEQADLFVSRGMFEDFFINLDQECGPLTLHSSLKDLVNYTRKGLDSIEHGRDRLSQTQTSMMCASNDYR